MEFTGLLTGSEYKSVTLCDGFPAQGVANASVVVIKTHYPFFPKRENIHYERAILLIRNPLNACVAEFNRRWSGKNHTGHAPLKKWENHFSNFMKKYGNKWQNMYIAWYRNMTEENRLFVRYLFAFSLQIVCIKYSLKTQF